MVGSTTKAKAGEGEAATESDDTKGEFIRYTGHTGVRVISEDDWKAIKVTGQGESVWDKTNAHRLPRSEFNAKALNYLLQVDGEFVAED